MFAELFDRRVQQAQTMGLQRTDLAVKDDFEQLVPAPEVAMERGDVGSGLASDRRKDVASSPPEANSPRLTGSPGSVALTASHGQLMSVARSLTGCADLGAP